MLKYLQSTAIVVLALLAIFQWGRSLDYRSEVIALTSERDDLAHQLSEANEAIELQNLAIASLTEAAADKDEQNNAQVEIIYRDLPAKIQKDLATTKDAAELNHWLQELYR